MFSAIQVLRPITRLEIQCKDCKIPNRRMEVEIEQKNEPSKKEKREGKKFSMNGN